MTADTKRLPVRRALISVSDKRGVVELARRLVEVGVEIVSSGGTARTLNAASVPVTAVAEITGAPEMLGGRVKTLHPKIHGGILADLGDEAHRRELAQHEIAPFQLVVANLYPFESTVAAPDVTEAEAIEQIDIGGPTMVRAAAKNHAWVGVVTSPDRYEEVARAVESGGLDADLRRRLAREAFFHTGAYDAAIVSWLDRHDPLPERLVMAWRRASTLRYGENPHQGAAVYRAASGGGWWDDADQLQGKEMSFNNYADAEAAWRLVNDLARPAAVVVKHTNACGAAVRDGVGAAFAAAWECDPVAAFGSVVALNRNLDLETADRIAGRFVEVVIAPKVDTDALDLLSAKKSLRLLEAGIPHGGDLDLRRVEDGLLVQQRDTVVLDAEGWAVVSARGPTEEEMENLAFAWTVAAHSKSNAIVVAHDLAAVGVGAGDQSRVGAAERALRQAGDRAGGGVAASDAFFPFRDGLDALAAAGVTAVIEPGGSKRDDEVVRAADERGVALVFTGRRHFRH